MMNNNSNSMMSPSSASSNNTQSPGLKTYFKTPEGKYKLQYEKTYPAGLLHFSHGKTVTQVTLAHLKDKPVQAQPHSTSTFGVTSGVKSAAARFLGGGNGSKSLSFVGGNGGSKSVSGMGGRAGSFGVTSSNNSVSIPNFDGKGTYLIFNVGDTIFISDLNSRDKDPIKSIHFGNSNPVCHAFDPDAKEGHDLLIGLSSGDDVGKKLVGAQHYNKDGAVNNSRCTSIAWVPNSDGAFVVAHADGNFYVYDKSKDGSADPSFPVIKDQTHFSVAHARYNKNPVARWHICQGSINSIAFSTDGAYIATVGRDGYLRIFDYKNEQLICGGKSYYGALLCCAWSMDGKYVLAGGEDDLVQVWSMDERKVVAWGEGHNSWVSGVAFDSYWSAPNSDGTDENVVYRFGSVGQDTQLLLWDLEMDEIVVPMRRPHGGSPTFSTGSQSSHWDRACPVGTLQPAPSTRDIPKLSPLVTHRVHTEPLSGVMFTHESVLTICREGHIKVWVRPEFGETQTNNSESLLSPTLKEKPTISGKIVSSKLQAMT
ncbi:probable catabolite repression protein creC isoform X2 [Lycium ferocissimum]|uniref:probable catabolite repression protein creC isoform X2 n=1 Tax=Lycium ferocissimum TaxID=112874 RepID=UPI002814C445|nr:probable catabolite repression protein creC isoform X2 [Lycium ferocissimum]